MARIVKAVRKPHDCGAELKFLELDNVDLLPGSIAECSCGLQYALKEEQFEGMYWAEIDKGVVAGFYKGPYVQRG